MQENPSLRKRTASAYGISELDTLDGDAEKGVHASVIGARDDETTSPARVKSHFEGEVPEEEDGQKPLWAAHYARKRFSALSLLPPLTWLPPYIRTALGRATPEDTSYAGGLPFSLQGDLIAGLTVGFMLVPQCLAFALLAGLPVQIGLYSSFGPLVAYAVFGTIRQVQPGPTALMSLICGQALDSLDFDTEAERIAAAALLSCFVGVISIILGMIRFGFIVDFMSHSVMAAFCSAAGVTICTSQLKHMFGIGMPRKKYWWQTAFHLITHLHTIHGATFAIGGTLLVALLAIKYWKSAGSKEKRQKHPVWRWLPKDKTSTVFRILKFVADLSSLMAVIIGWLWGFLYKSSGVSGVNYVGDVDAAGFAFLLPGSGLGRIQYDSLLISALVMATVGFLETMAVGGKFAMQSRYDYEPNQELLALGIANCVSGIMSGYPGTGSFSRTAVNAMCGATSLLSPAISALIVFGAMYFLLDVIGGLPLASLAPIIIQGAIGVIDVHSFVIAFNASKAEFFVMLATFTVSLALTVKEGLLVGFVLSVLKTMNDLANPNLAACGMLPDHTFRDIRNFPNAQLIRNAVVVRIDARLSFANSRKMKEFCFRAVEVRESQGDKIVYVIIDGKSINHVDLTGCEMLEMLAESLKSRSQCLIVANLKGPALKCLTAAGVAPILKKHDGHLCIDMDQAIAIAHGDGTAEQLSMDSVKELVKRVDTSRTIIKSVNQSPFYACGKSPKDVFMQNGPGHPMPTTPSSGQKNAATPSGNDSPARQHSGSTEDSWSAVVTAQEGAANGDEMMAI